MNKEIVSEIIKRQYTIMMEEEKSLRKLLQADTKKNTCYALLHQIGETKMHATVIIFDWDDTIIDIGDILASCQYLACQDTPPPETHWSLPPKSAFYSQKGARFLETIIPCLFGDYDPKQPPHIQWGQSCYNLFRDYYKNTSTYTNNATYKGKL